MNEFVSRIARNGRGVSTEKNIQITQDNRCGTCASPVHSHIAPPTSEE